MNVTLDSPMLEWGRRTLFYVTPKFTFNKGVWLRAQQVRPRTFQLFDMFDGNRWCSQTFVMELGSMRDMATVCREWLMGSVVGASMVVFADLPVMYKVLGENFANMPCGADDWWVAFPLIVGCCSVIL